MVFSRKTKVSRYKSEINKSVTLHAFLKKQRYRFTVFDKNTKVSYNKEKYRVTVVNQRGSITRGLLSFCVYYARIVKVHSLINKITFNDKNA